VNWQERAQRLAQDATLPASRWRPVVASVPRHLFTPAWWERDNDHDRNHWERDGRTGWTRWDATTAPNAPYRNRSLITQVATSHADHASPGDHAEGPPTSSATLPSLTVTMYRLAMAGDAMDALDVGTGSGYGCALLCTRLGDQHVTSIDVDPYLVSAATRRLDQAGLHPNVWQADATGPLDGTWDRIIATTSVSPVPASWLAALRPGGRLVTTISGTCLIITADKTPDGGAAGRAEWHKAGFMTARHGPGYPPALITSHPHARDGDGDDITTGPYPVTDTGSTWDLYSMLGLTMPGTQTHYQEHDGQRTAWLVHPDGSWARATGAGDQPAVIHQAGPRRLWDHLDSLRRQWLSDGELPAYGSTVTIDPDGATTFTRGTWKATIPTT
jgi:protein-L-isoaspartate O-methyltransferase